MECVYRFSFWLLGSRSAWCPIGLALLLCAQIGAETMHERGNTRNHLAGVQRRSARPEPKIISCWIYQLSLRAFPEIKVIHALIMYANLDWLYHHQQPTEEPGNNG